jgi:Zn finger protein HypA/HybF involved in hydrogenase expression
MNLSDFNEVIEEELDLEPVEIQCDGCSNRFTRHDESYSRYVEPMWMLLCPQCAEDAGWIEKDD